MSVEEFYKKIISRWDRIRKRGNEENHEEEKKQKERAGGKAENGDRNGPEPELLCFLFILII